MMMTQDGVECKMTKVKTKSWKPAEDGVIVKLDLSEKLNHIFSSSLKGQVQTGSDTGLRQ